MEITTLERAETEYTVNDDGTRIANIPFEKFISEGNKPENAVTADIDESAAGEDNSKSINTAIKALTDGGVICIPYACCKYRQNGYMQQQQCRCHKYRAFFCCYRM